MDEMTAEEKTQMIRELGRNPLLEKVWQRIIREGQDLSLSGWLRFMVFSLILLALLILFLERIC